MKYYENIKFYIKTQTIVHKSAQKPFEVGYYNGDDKQKAIINVSCATGCPVGCNFCDLTDSGGPLTPEIIYQQVEDMLFVAKAVDGYDPTNKPLKINFAKTGEPLLSRHIVDAMDLISSKVPGTSFKISTSMPDVPQVQERIKGWAQFASEYQAGSVQLQISLISTSDSFRQASVGTLQKFTAIQASFLNHFNHQRHLENRQTFKNLRQESLYIWQNICVS